MRVVDNVGFNVKKQDIPGGGSGGGSAQPLATPDWNQNDETAADYIKNRPCYRKETFTETELITGTFTFAKNFDTDLYITRELDSIVLVDGQTYTVVFDGVRYDNLLCIGEDTDMTGEGDFAHVSTIGSGDPFAYQYVTQNGVKVMAMFSTKIAGDTHDITINKIDYDYVKLPEYYLPDERIILKSTTSDSTKKFAITVDDSGTLTATEVTG